MGGWRETPEGQWWEDDLGVVIGVQGTVWFAYPERGCGRIGPFASLLEAQRAVERQERGSQVDATPARDLFEDDDRPTEKLQRPSGISGSFGSTDG